LEEIRERKHTLLVTFRRDGTPVPTPAWAAEEGGALYVRAERASGKVRRLRRDPRMLIAPCTGAGRPLGAPLEAFGCVVAREDERRAERALASSYGFGRVLFELSADLLRADMCYLEITPRAWEVPLT
jgi:PPOX class probable F420-dependent enzyme